MNDLKTIATLRGVELIKKGKGHYQLQGPLLVNYYPNSKNKTAYVAGTFRSVKHVTPKQAVAMCFEQPMSQGESDKRGKNTRRKRAALIRRGVTNCHWCKAPLTLDTSTLEHIIPLASNGLDNNNNRTLACKPCNNMRGSNMPELTTEPVQDKS